MWGITARNVTRLQALAQRPPVLSSVAAIFIHSQRGQILKWQKADGEEQDEADFLYLPCFSGCQPTDLCAVR